MNHHVIHDSVRCLDDVPVEENLSPFVAGAPAGPEVAELVKFADMFDQAAAATRACVGLIQQSVEVRSRDIYYASFPCFSASNGALAQARANLNELLQLLGVPLEI